MCSMRSAVPVHFVHQWWHVVQHRSNTTFTSYVTEHVLDMTGTAVLTLAVRS